MLSARHWEQVHAFQAQEMLRLVEDRKFARAAAREPHYTRIAEWLDPARGRRVLELGCGPGRYVAMLAQLGFDVIGVDPVPYPNWDTIREKLPVEFMPGIEAASLPFADGTFDHVACLGALLYFPDDRKAMTEIHRVLKPGGRVVVRTINRDNLYTARTGKKLDPASHNLYSEAELRALLTQSGFAVVESFSYGFWPPLAADYWWYLVNGHIPIGVQRLISALTPARRRVNLIAFAERRP